MREAVNTVTVVTIVNVVTAKIGLCSQGGGEIETLVL
jgi:hypothetical protein